MPCSIWDEDKVHINFYALFIQKYQSEKNRKENGTNG